jgi:hypothetical protein
LEVEVALEELHSAFISFIHEIGGDWVLKLLDRLEGKAGTFELYIHPARGPQEHDNQELMALMSPKVRNKIAEKGIRLIRYLDMIKQR